MGRLGKTINQDRWSCLDWRHPGVCRTSDILWKTTATRPIIFSFEGLGVADPTKAPLTPFFKLVWKEKGAIGFRPMQVNRLVIVNQEVCQTSDLFLEYFYDALALYSPIIFSVEDLHLGEPHVSQAIFFFKTGWEKSLRMTLGNDKVIGL